MLLTVVAAASICVASASASAAEGVKIKIVHGSGCQEDEAAKLGDHLELHYVGKVDDEDGAEFDSSRKRGVPFKFQLGSGSVRETIIL